MKAFVLACLLAAARASPLLGASHYQALDLLGGYAFSHAGGPSARHEVRTPDGVTSGSYSYIDANGIVQHSSYVADPIHGFRVAATNLPVAPVAHIASPLALSPIAPLLAHPSVPADTPEVAAAKVAHAAAHAEALHRARRSPAYYGPPAPLSADGNVAPTAEFAAEASRLAAAHAQEHTRLAQAAALAAAHPDNTSPPGSYNSGPSYNQGPSYNPGPSYNQGQSYNQGPSYNPAPSYNSYNPSQSYNSYNPAASQPAPLNSDGTVAETPEIQALKASHLAAHQQALQRTAAYGPSQYNPAPHQGQHWGRKRRSAPLNPDGTVAPTPEVAAATAAHLAALSGAAYPYYGAALPHYGAVSVVPHVRYTPPAPLNPDGTVAETPEVHALSAAHHAAKSQQLHVLAAQDALAIASGPEDGSYVAGPLAYYHGAPVVGYSQPAPLNPDGTVAHTPEYLAVAASHSAAHHHG